MREPVCTVRVVRVRRDGLLDLRSRSRELPILGQRHGVIGQEPRIIAAVRGEAVHQHRDLVLLTDAAGGAEQAVRVRGAGEHQRVARPRRQMRAQRGERGVGPAREYEVEERDVADFPRRSLSHFSSGLLASSPITREAHFPVRRGATIMYETPSCAKLTDEITEVERQAIRRVSHRLLPMLMACYFVAYLDRVNVGFASLTMNKALGFSSAVYGFGGGIFFLGYFIFEVPSNILLSKIGARRWIARILA